MNSWSYILQYLKCFTSRASCNHLVCLLSVRKLIFVIHLMTVTGCSNSQFKMSSFFKKVFLMRVSFRNSANKCIFVTQCAVDLLASSNLFPYILPSCMSCDFNVTVSEATHQSFQLAEGDGGTVEEIGRQPALVLVTMSNGCAWEGGERERESWGTDCRAERRLEARFIYCHYYMVIRWAAWKTIIPSVPLGQGTAAGRPNFVLGHQIPASMAWGQLS